MKVNQNQLVEILRDTDADNVTVLSETPVKMNKTGNPFYAKEGRKMVEVNVVTKRTINTYGFNLNYKDEVNRELKNAGKEADYQAAERSWAETVVPNKVIRHKGNGTLYLIVFNSFIANKPTIAKESEYYVDGIPATDEQMEIISQFEIGHTSGVKKQEDAGLTWENQVSTQTIKFDNIISIVIDNTMYELTD